MFQRVRSFYFCFNDSSRNVILFHNTVLLYVPIVYVTASRHRLCVRRCSFSSKQTLNIFFLFKCFASLFCRFFFPSLEKCNICERIRGRLKNVRYKRVFDVRGFDVYLGFFVLWKRFWFFFKMLLSWYNFSSSNYFGGSPTGCRSDKHLLNSWRYFR